MRPSSCPLVLLLAIVAALSGCTRPSMMDPSAMMMRAAAPERFGPDAALAESLFKEDQAVLSNEDLQRILAAKVTLPDRAKLAVVRFGRLPYWWGWSEDFVRLNEEIDSNFLGTLRESGRLREVAYLPSLVTPNLMTLPYLRQSAARCQADLVLVYRTSTRTYTKQKWFAADRTRAYCTVEAVVLDTRTGLVPFSTVVNEYFSASKTKGELDFAETVAKAEQKAIGQAWQRVARETVTYLDGQPATAAAATGPGRSVKRNPKSEFRNPKQIQSTKKKAQYENDARRPVLDFPLGFWTCFGFRASDFGFRFPLTVLVSPAGCGYREFMASTKLPLGVVAAALSSDSRSAPGLARAAGFGGLQFDAYSSALDIPDLSASGKREFRRLLSSQDQRLVGLRWDAGPKGLGPGADVDRALARVERVMEAAAGLAAPLVSVELGPLPEPAQAPKPKPRATREQAGLILLLTGIEGEAGTAASAAPQAAGPAPDPAFVSHVDGALAELCRRADRYSVTVALRSELASFAALERALRQVNCPWFGIDLDPVAVLRDAWDSDEVFSRLGNLIRHVRGRDALRGADRRTKPAPVGSGSTDWEQLLSNLDASGYAGWITVDPIELTDRAGAAAQARERLAKLRA